MYFKQIPRTTSKPSLEYNVVYNTREAALTISTSLSIIPSLSISHITFFVIINAEFVKLSSMSQFG